MAKSPKRSPSIPLKKGKKFNSPPFLRGAGGDLKQFLNRFLIIPDDLMTALSSNLAAKEFFLNLSRTDKCNLLQWITLAKREETRQKRIREIVFSAENQRKPI
ncbi:YdeI/OmpD-associated family protein [Pseudanabaena galeata]|jgi:uncharacterized protein YdeI (YjbR/CyaY-like superfamily)|uniref:YdeI/OmpD-associated family protein n=1 Tax=Pseudanabaena TaxID=1152 RepID=UPI00387E640A